MTASDLTDKTLWTSSTDGAEQEWIEAIEGKSLKQDHLRWLGSRIVEEFIKHAVKDPITVSEVVLLGPVLDQTHYRRLLNCFIEEFRKSVLLDGDLLQGLVQLVQCASPTFLDADDLILILSILRLHLGQTHQQSSQHLYHLTLAVSRLLEVMANPAYQIKDLHRVEERQPLAGVLSGLQASSDPYLMYQALYAFQALQYVPDDESTLQAVMRYALGATESLIKISGVIQLNTVGLLEGLKQMQKTFEETCGNAKSSYEGVSSLIDSGRGLFDRLKMGLVSGHKHPWYPAVLTATALCRAGQLKDFSKLVREVPCRRDPRFQWGVSQLLGEIAIDQEWLLSIREQAVTFLGGLYLHDADWGQDDSVKSWMLTILCKISEVPEPTVREMALTYLQPAANDDSTIAAHPYPSRSQLPIPVSSPLLALAQEIPYVEYDLNRFRFQRLSAYSQDVYIPPQAKVNIQASDDETVALMPKVEEFLKSDGQVFLVLGDSGTGKSTFNRYLEHELWEEYKPGGSIPLFINLPSIDNPCQDMIGKQLLIHGFKEDQIKELKENRKMILICDGYDEAQLYVNLHSENMFNRKGQPDTKMIISCRSTYLGHDYRDQFRPQQSDRHSVSAANVYIELVIIPLSQGQIEYYTDQFARDPEVHKLMGGGTIWSIEDYMRMLQSIPNLMELVKNPFLLSLALRALPGVVKDGADISKTKWTRLTLCNSLIDQWLEISKKRLRTIKRLADAESALQELLDGDFVKIVLDFLKDLAAAIYKEQGGRSVVRYTHRIDKGTWKAAFFGPKPDITILREASPLSRSGTQYRFLHRSLLEYLYSRHIYETSETVDVSSNVSEGLAKHPLSQMDLVREPSIIQFLAEHAQHNYDFRQKLQQIIERSKTDDLASQAAANAVTVLFKSGVRLSSIDMRGTRISGADLSDGELDSAQLQGADLRDVNFSRSWLRQANFSHATMTGAQFGEWPFLEVDTDPTACAYSMDGNSLAVGLSNGGIILYDTSTWECTFTLPGHLKAITAIAFSPTKSQFFSASRDGTWKVWDLDVGEPAWVDNSHGGIVTDMVVSPDGLRLGTSGSDKLIRLWGSSTLKQVNLLKGHDEVVTCLAFSPCGTMLVSGSGDRSTRLWNSSDGRTKLILQGHSNTISSVAFAPHGRHIVSGGFDTSVRVWDVETGDQIAILSKHTDRISTVTWSPSGTQIISASWDKTVRVWDTVLRNQVTVLRGATKAVSSLAVSPNGQQIAACSNDKTVRLWDATSGLSSALSSGVFLEGANSNGHTRGVSAMIVAPDGQQLVTGGYDATVRTCDAFTGKSIGVPLRVHTKVVAAIAFSLCGRLLASSSWDHTLRLWRNWGTKCIVWMKERPEWENNEKQGFIIGCKDGSIRAWRLSMKEDKAQVKLEWGTGFGNLVATKTRIDGVVGLSSIVRKLLMQRGAVEEQAT
ncbi:unnamed protein product [Mortierella alpina]